MIMNVAVGKRLASWTDGRLYDLKTVFEFHSILEIVLVEEGQ